MISNTTLYLIWSILPAYLVFQFFKNKLIETTKNKKNIIIRSKYYKQVLLFTIASMFVAGLICEYLLPVLIDDTKLLVAAKYALLPVVLAIIAPYAGSNKPRETIHDKIKRKGYRELIKKRDEK